MYGKRIIGVIVRGIIIGLTLYIVFIKIIPFLMQNMLPGHVEGTIATTKYLYLILIAVIIGMIAKALEGTPYSFPLSFLEKLYGTLVLYKILNGGIIKGTITTHNMTITYWADISLLVYITIILIIALALLDIKRIYMEE